MSLKSSNPKVLKEINHQNREVTEVQNPYDLIQMKNSRNLNKFDRHISKEELK